MTRLIFPSSSIRPVLVCRRPAVSMITVSTPRSMPSLTAVNATLAGSAPSRSERTVSAPTRSPQVWSWSAAAARNVSAAPSSTVWPSPISARARRPQAVVLPVPLTPTTRTTAGRSPCGCGVQRPVQVGPDLGQQVGPQQRPDLGRVAGAGHLDLGAQLLDQLAGRAHAHVRRDQRVLDLLPGLLVQGGGGQQVEQHRAERRLRPGQPAAQPDQPAGRRRRLLEGPGGRSGWLDRGADVRRRRDGAARGGRLQGGRPGPAPGARAGARPLASGGAVVRGRRTTDASAAAGRAARPRRLRRPRRRFR